jgi:hypothetical protein
MSHAFTRLRPARFVWLVLSASLAFLVAVCALPENRYMRFSALTEDEVVKAKWIYERIHFDQTPIDVVFIGTSRSVAGIDSEIVERTCRDAGGKYCSSVNFGMLHLGRNMHWLLAREVMERRKPRLLVVEVQETEYRALHPAFPYFADEWDLVSAPIVINPSFFTDLGRLPTRQISLFAETVAPRLFSVRTEFDPALYRGPHWDDTTGYDRAKVASVETLEAERSKAASAAAAKLRLPGALQKLEYRANVIYLKKILDLARQKNIEIMFLYLPQYHDEKAPLYAELYDGYGPTCPMPGEIRNHHELWKDVDHLNSAGAVVLSRFLGSKVAELYPGPDGVARALTTR